MRYLVTWDYIETGASLPAESVSKLLQGAIAPSLDICAQYEKEKKFLAGGVFAGGRSSAVIVDVESHDELNQLLQSLPFWSLMKMQVTPLQTFAERSRHEKNNAEIFEKLRAAGALPW